jgi:transposase-like protein
LAQGAEAVLGPLTLGPFVGSFEGRTDSCRAEDPRGSGGVTVDFPLIDLMDERACYDRLVDLLHPGGLACPRCGSEDRLGIHRRHREPVLDYQCGHCRRVFNAFTGTPLQGIRRRPSQLLLILRGIAQAEPTARMARELGCDRKHLLQLRHRLQDDARLGRDRNPPDDAVVEADEAYVNAGEKRHPAPGSGRPAASPGQQAPRARHVRNRPAAGAGGGRPPDRRGRFAGRRPH